MAARRVQTRASSSRREEEGRKDDKKEAPAPWDADASSSMDMNNPPSFYSFFAEQEVHGNGFVIYRYESHVSTLQDVFSGQEESSGHDESQYDYLEGRSLSDNRITKYLLEQAEMNLLPALWKPNLQDHDEDGVFGKEEEEDATSIVDASSYSKRRTKQLSFTCKLCHTRMNKLINPHAWENGSIVIKCEGCGVKHQLVDNLGVFDLLNMKPRKNPRHTAN
jgi:hypothetical protein